MIIDKQLEGVIGSVDLINPAGPLNGETSKIGILSEFFKNMSPDEFKKIAVKEKTQLFMLQDLTGISHKRGWPLLIGTGDPGEVGVDRFQNDINLIKRVVGKHANLKFFISDRDPTIVKLSPNLDFIFCSDIIHGFKNCITNFLKGGKMLHFYQRSMDLDKMFEFSTLNLRKVDKMSPRQNLAVCRSWLKADDEVINAAAFILIIAFDAYQMDITVSHKPDQTLNDESRACLLAITHIAQCEKTRKTPGMRRTTTTNSSLLESTTIEV